jgi:hypothetical protein
MWASAGVFIEGGNPYENDAVSLFSKSHGAGDTIDLPIYLPPSAYPLLVPLGALSFEVARFAFLAGGALFLLVRWIIPAIRVGLNAPLRGAIAVSSYLTFFPVTLMWWVGPMSLWPVVGIALFCALQRWQQRGVAALFQGAALSLLLVKPTCVPLVLPFAFGYLLGRRAKMAIFGFLLGAAYAALGAVAWVDLSIDELLVRARETQLWQTPAPLRVLGLTDGPVLQSVIPCLLGACGAFYLGLRSCSYTSFVTRLGLLVVPLGFMVSPFVWTYDFSPLIFSIEAITLSMIGRASIVEGVTKSGEALLSFGALLFNVLLAFSPLAMEFHWWYPVGYAVLGGWSYYLRSQKMQNL